jgi:glycosyltransferase involved in cell wall biosynthesis
LNQSNPIPLLTDATFAGKARMSVSVVVPIYDEADNIPQLYEALSAVMRRMRIRYEIILVNDGSQDGSAERLDELAEDDSHVKVIEFRRNYGQTAAMRAGIQAASMDTIVLLDGDLQNDPNDIPKLLAKLEEGFDLAHGWRKDRQDTFLDRKLPSKMANWLISKVTGFPAHDIGCTLKAIRTEIAQELDLYGEMHRFIPILAHWRGARCVEVETTHHSRLFGQSKYGISRTLRVLLDLVTVKYLIHYSTSPMKLFGSFGLASFLLSGLTGIAAARSMAGSGAEITAYFLLFVAALFSLAGSQFLFFGILGELCSRIYFASQNKTNYAIRRTMNFEESTIPFRRRRAA